VPHHLPSFFFVPEDFARLRADIASTKFGITMEQADGMLAETKTFTRLKADNLHQNGNIYVQTMS